MDTISLRTIPETVAALHVDPTKEDSPPDANVNGSSRKKSKKRRKKKKKKKKEETLCEEEKTLDVAEKLTNEDQTHPPKNPLSNIRIQEDSCQQAQASCEKPEDSEPGATDMTSSERKKKRRKKRNKDKNALMESGVDTNSEVTMECDARHKPKAQGSKLKSTEEKAGDGTVVNGCLKSKDDTVGEQKGADATDMTSSERKKKRRKKKNKDKNALRESGVDTNSEVTMECDARHKPKAQGSKLKSTEEKTVDGTVVNGCLKSKDDTVGEQKGADATVSETQSPKAKKKKRRKTKTTEALENTLATSMETGPVECMETAGVCEVKSKKRKRKRKKTSSTDQETADMEVCDPSESTLLTTIESGSVECLLDHSNKEVLESCDKNAGQQLVGEDGLSKTEKSATGEICGVQSPGTRKEKTKDENGEPKKKRRKKKKKSCEDHKTDNMDTQKDNVSVPRSEGEVEFDGGKLDTQLSSSVLIQETGDLPRCSCKGQSTRKLIVFDLNGILADIARGHTGDFVPDGKISSRSVFKRPFVGTFLDFCFERFDVGIWSSRRIGLGYMTAIVMGSHARNLLFSFGQSVCITTNFKTLENTTKPLFLKDLRRVWNRFGTCLSCGKRKYDETNTLLVDDSPDKALCNPPYTGIFPFPYQYTDREDSALGPDGELRKYMERLVDAENVQKFVEENPIGQSAITETHESWSFYSRVIKAYKN